MCGKCREVPAVKGQAWCTRCSTAYQSARQSTVILQATAKGFGRGAEAMREALANEFARLGGAKVTCDEIGRAIRVSPLPKMTESAAG